MVGRRDNVKRLQPEVRGVHPIEGARCDADVIALQSAASAHSPFHWGVASGDPWPGGVVLWTRLDLPAVVPSRAAGPSARVVRWELAADAGFARVLQRGSALAHMAHGSCVHVEVQGLVPGGVYWYRFHCAGHTSETGCTRSAPALLRSPCEGVRFAVVDADAGEAFDAIARDDLDFALLVLPRASACAPSAGPLERLDHARSDVARPLRAAQRALPFVAMPATGAQNALRAWWPHLPLRGARLDASAPLLTWGAVARLALAEQALLPGASALCGTIPRWSLHPERLRRGALRALERERAARLAYVRIDASLEDVQLDVLALPSHPGLPSVQLASYTLRNAADVAALA
jgi:hypothetical protein